jgi:hypothetical protein
MRKNAPRIFAISALLLAALGALLGAEAPPRAAPWYDYSALMKILPNSADLRYPTEKELKGFPVLWPTVPVEQNAAFYYTKAAPLFRSTGAPPGSVSALETYAGDLAALDSWVAANQPALDAMIAARAHPVCRLPVFFSVRNGFLDSWFPTHGIR